jgi:integrase
MQQYNAQNERIKYHYFELLEEGSKGYSRSTIKCIRESIYRYEHFTGLKDFCAFNKEFAISFKKHVLGTPSRRTGQTLSKSYVLHCSKNLMAFFEWLSNQPAYKAKIRRHEIEYFSLSREDRAIALAATPRRCISVDQINKAIKNMPRKTPVEKRNRALMTLLLLTGARITALISLKIKHLDLAEKNIHQHPVDVKTKNRKRIRTFFFPVGGNCLEIIEEYAQILIQDLKFSSNDPLFPRNMVGEPPNSTSELGKAHWQSPSSARKIIKSALEQVGFLGYCPHSFRNSLVQLAYKLCRTPEEFKAWSVNLGHKNVITTFESYGHIDEFRQGDIMKSFSKINT